MKQKRIVLIVLVVVLVLSLALVGLTACGNKDKNKGNKKAIIYVTALFGGGLYNDETKAPAWDPFFTEMDLYDHVDDEGNMDFIGIIGEYTGKTSDDRDWDDEGQYGGIMTMLTSALTFEEGTLLYDLSLDQDGNPLNPHVVPATLDSKDKDGNLLHVYYGAVGIYKPFIVNPQEEFKNYDVLVFNQDWRKNPAESAALLEQFINRAGYEEVILMSHSMGGQVCNSYLARSEANRNKVKRYLAFAPATLGSFDAYAAMTCPLEYMTSFLATFNLDLSSLNLQMIDINAMIQGGLDAVAPFFNNSEGMMALCPAWELLSSDQYANNAQGGFVIDGRRISSKEELYEFYERMPWAFYLDEEGNKMKVDDTSNVPAGWYINKDGYRIKPGVAKITQLGFYENMYVDGKIAMNYVDEYIFVGRGITSTITGINLTTIGEDEDGYPIYSYEIVHADQAEVGEEGWIGGDGQVCLYASLAGQSYAEMKAANRLIEIPGRWHMDIGGCWAILGTDVMRLIREAANN